MIYNSSTSSPSQSMVTHVILVWVFFMNKRILIAEGNLAISKLINMKLAFSGYQTVCALDGWQAVEAGHAQRFDLALCDIMLTELDGFELLPYMKEKNIPVIYISANTDELSRVQELRLGAEDNLESHLTFPAFLFSPCRLPFFGYFGFHWFGSSRFPGTMTLADICS